MSNLYVGTQRPEKIYVGDQSVNKVYLGAEEVWSSQDPDWFWVESADGYDIDFSFYGVGVSTPPNLSYKINDGEWASYNWTTSGSNSVGEEIYIVEGDKLYFKGVNNTLSSSSSSYIKALSSASTINAGGHISSLLVGDAIAEVTEKPYCFYMFFGDYNNCLIQDASQLICDVMGAYCYSRMFWGSDSLVSAPQLPLITASEFAYENMFYYCRALTTAPSLPATTLGANCYFSMFMSCSSLTTPPALPATSVAPYASMFRMCSSLQVWDTAGSGHNVEWRIPTNGIMNATTSQGMTFDGCAGTRSSDNLVFNNNQRIFYTQNSPV